MKINNLRLVLFCLLLIIIQLTINNLSIFYVDLMAIVLVGILLSGNFTWAQLIVLGLVADLIGHWYLGSHVLAITLLSLISSSFINFYRICTWFQRSVISSGFFLLLLLILYLIQLLTGKNYSSPLSVVLEVLLLIPLVQLFLNLFVIRGASEYFYHE